MNPEKYSAALRAVRYSRLLTPEETKPFLDAHYSGDGEALRVLKDKFADEGDPRADIWDRQVGNTTHPTFDREDFGRTPVHIAPLEVEMGYYKNNDPHGGSNFLFRPIASSEYATKPTDVGIHFSTKSVGYKKPNGTLFRAGVFTPAEARTLADKFPEEHAQRIHQFLDTHFGPRPEPEAV